MLPSILVGMAVYDNSPANMKENNLQFLPRFVHFHPEASPPFSGSPVPGSFSSTNADMVKNRKMTRLFLMNNLVIQVFVLEGRHPEFISSAAPNVDPTVVSFYESEAGLAVLRVTVDYSAKELRISNDYIVGYSN